MDYMTLKEASQKWNVTPRQINYFNILYFLALFQIPANAA